MRHQIGDVQDADIRQLVDAEHSPAHRAVVVNPHQLPLASSQNQLELIAGNLAARCVAGFFQTVRAIAPCVINELRLYQFQLHQLPVRKRACTNVPGLPLATQSQPNTTYLLPAVPASVGTLFRTKSPCL